MSRRSRADGDVSVGQTIRLIAGREVRQRLRSRLFVGTTIGLSGLLTLLTLAPAAFGMLRVDTLAVEDREPTVVAVVGALNEGERAALAMAVGRVEEREVADEAAAQRLVEDGVADLAIIDAERVLEPPPEGVFLVGPDVALDVAEALALAAVLEDVGVGAEGVSAAVDVEPLAVEYAGAFDPGEQMALLVLANIGVVFLFAVLTLYATLIVNGIIEEKGSRVIEVLVETVPVRQLMAGKLLGLGTVGLGQTFVLFAPPAAAVAMLGTIAVPTGVAAPLALIALWFLLGYAFYSVVAAALGALVSRPEEAQAVLTPASVLTVTGYLVGFFSINSPDGTLAVVAGWIPPTAPYVMLVRQLLGSPSTLEVAGAVTVTLGATAALAVLASRIYAGGLLQTRGRVGVRHAWRSATD